MAAGMAGLLCAQRLRHLRYQVIVIEKSRAPQVVPLLAPFAEQMPDLLAAVQSVKFAPCITAIATYAPESAVQLAEISWKAM